MSAPAQESVAGVPAEQPAAAAPPQTATPAKVPTSGVQSGGLFLIGLALGVGVAWLAMRPRPAARRLPELDLLDEELELEKEHDEESGR